MLKKMHKGKQKYLSFFNIYDIIIKNNIRSICLCIGCSAVEIEYIHSYLDRLYDKVCEGYILDKLNKSCYKDNGIKYSYYFSSLITVKTTNTDGTYTVDLSKAPSGTYVKDENDGYKTKNS